MNTKTKSVWCISILTAAALFSGCETAVPKGALAMSPMTLENRKMSSRKFQTKDEEKVIKACAALLQDLGFTMSESSVKLGMLAGYKDRTAVQGGQVAGKIVMAALFGVNVAIDANQKMKASVITQPSKENPNETVVRVTFQRIVFDENNQISRLEQLKDVKYYKEFFDALGKSLFLTANDI